MINLCKTYKHGITPQECFNLIIDLKKATQNFKDYEKDTEKIKLVLGKIRNDEKFITNVLHYTFYEKGNSIHQTSNTNFKLEHNQKIDISIPEIVKPASIKPGTIVTRNIMFIGKKEAVWLPQHQIQSIKHNNLNLFDLPNDEIKYIQEKKMILKEIFLTNLNSDISDQDIFLRDIEIGNYTAMLENSKNYEIEDMIENILDK